MIVFELIYSVRYDVYLVVLFFPSQALALLSDYVNKEDPAIRIGAIMGLGIAYAGAQNEQVRCSPITSGFLLNMMRPFAVNIVTYYLHDAGL